MRLFGVKYELSACPIINCCLKSQYCGDSVVFLQAFPFRHEFAEGLFFFAFQDRKSVENVDEFVAGKPVEMGYIAVNLGPGHRCRAGQRCSRGRRRRTTIPGLDWRLPQQGDGGCPVRGLAYNN